MSYKETELDTGMRETPISCFLERRALQTEAGADPRRKMLTRREGGRKVLRREIPDGPQGEPAQCVVENRGRLLEEVGSE